MEREGLKALCFRRFIDILSGQLSVVSNGGRFFGLTMKMVRKWRKTGGKSGESNKLD